MKMTHVRLLVTDFPGSFRFYRDVMGFPVHWGNEQGGYASFHVGQGESFMLAIFPRAEMAAAVGAAHLPVQAGCQDRAALIVQTGDVDAMAGELRARGADVSAPQDRPDWGIRVAYLRDPDGNLIELFSDLPRSEWSPELLDADRNQGG
jgi:catechol 2,3-dioxygenase-like lactoylglutathione lyase family enzyme